MEYTYGYPQIKRINELQEACNSSKETHSEEYQGHYRPLPVAEVRIELLVYRIEKLEKIIGLDIRTFDDALTLKIALMVVNYMKYLEQMDY